MIVRSQNRNMDIFWLYRSRELSCVAWGFQCMPEQLLEGTFEHNIKYNPICTTIVELIENFNNLGNFKNQN